MVILVVAVVLVENARADDMDDPLLCAVQCIARQRAAEERELGRRR
jgi:hypothetical protein